MTRDFPPPRGFETGSFTADEAARSGAVVDGPWGAQPGGVAPASGGAAVPGGAPRAGTPPTARPTVSVAVFAHNEAERIGACLDALCACAGEARLLVHVLMNGCTDGTERAVRAHAAPGIELRPVVIGPADKADTWNRYAHELAPEEAEVHVFTDGDVTVGPGSIAGFLGRFAAEPEAHGCAGLPSTGRSRDAFREALVLKRQLAGNLYALRGACLTEFRRRGIRLPFGLVGEDGLVTTLIRWGLDTTGQRDDRRITACAEATFAFRSLSPLRPGDVGTYRRRKLRYALRDRQDEMLYPMLFERGVEAMPAHVADLYRARRQEMRGRPGGPDALFDWFARRRVRREAAADGAQTPRPRRPAAAFAPLGRLARPE